MIYPLVEELPVIDKLLAWLHHEIKHANIYRDKILSIIRDSSSGPRCGLFTQICNDVLALMGDSWSEDCAPIETEVCLRIQNREDRIRHIITWIESYRKSSPEASLYHTLFKGSLARLNIDGKHIAVTEAMRLHDGCILCYSDEWTYFIKYIVSYGFNDVERVYKLNGSEVELYKSRKLNIKDLCMALGCYVD